MSPEETVAMEAIKATVVALAEVKRPNPFAHIGPGSSFGDDDGIPIVSRSARDAMIASLDAAANDQVAVGRVLGAFGSIIPAFEAWTGRFLG